MRPARNGVSPRIAEKRSRQTRANHNKKAPYIRKPTGKPIGRAPVWMKDEQREIWNRLVRELEGLEKSHRAWLTETVMAFYRCGVINEFFARREIEKVEGGYDPAEAYITDDGKRHPMMLELHALGESVRKHLAALGANPSAQARLHAAADGAGRERGGGSDKSRFIK